MLQRWPGGGGGGGGGGGPTLLQTAGAAHHLTADSYGRCDPILPRLGRSRAEPSGGPSQSQQTSKPLTQEERENNMEEAVETGPMRDGCLDSVFTRRSWTDLLSFFLSAPGSCHCEELTFSL